jgi:hypothetical protein
MNTGEAVACYANERFAKCLSYANVFLTLQGLALLVVEEAIDAALKVVRSAVNTAFGFALIA